MATENKTETAAAVTEATKPATPNALDLAHQVLTELKPGAHHHTTIERKAIEMKVNPTGIDLATRVWSDTKKNGTESRFRFYGKSCYGLAAWPTPSDEQVKSAVPTRTVTGGGRQQTPEQLKARIASTEQQLVAMKAKLAELEAAATVKAAAAPAPAAPAASAPKPEGK